MSEIVLQDLYIITDYLSSLISNFIQIHAKFFSNRFSNQFRHFYTTLVKKNNQPIPVE